MQDKEDKYFDKIHCSDETKIELFGHNYNHMVLRVSNSTTNVKKYEQIRPQSKQLIG